MVNRSSTECPNFIMFDERTNTTKGCLEGRKTVGRLLCDIQKDFGTVHRSLHLYCCPSEPLELGSNPVCSPELEAPRKKFSMSFLSTTGYDLKEGRNEVACKIEGPKPRGVSQHHTRDSARSASAKMDRCYC